MRLWSIEAKGRFGKQDFRYVAEEAVEAVVSQAEINNYGVGSMTIKEFIPGIHIACFENGSDTNRLQQAATSLACDRMIVDKEDTGHFLLSMRRSLCRSKILGSVLASLSWRLPFSRPPPTLVSTGRRAIQKEIAPTLRRGQVLGQASRPREGGHPTHEAMPLSQPQSKGIFFQIARELLPSHIRDLSAVCMFKSTGSDASKRD
jgi:hypothetical protein